jgi:hypothetical protein
MFLGHVGRGGGFFQILANLLTTRIGPAYQISPGIKIRGIREEPPSLSASDWT